MSSVLVTGASSGIGEATARRLARAGWRVYAGVRKPGDAPDGTEEILLDVTNTEQIDALRRIDELHGVVNNAGIAVASPLELLPLDELRRQLEVNVIGQIAVTQAVLPALRVYRGRVVIVGSIAGLNALPFLGPYSASKFALEGIADSMRMELEPFGIDVTIIEPGTIATPIWTKGAEKGAALREQWPPEGEELYGTAVDRLRRAAAAAAGRGVRADEVAKVVEHALTARRPKTRYLVGTDAKRRAIVQHLPDRVRDRVLARYLSGRA